MVNYLELVELSQLSLISIRWTMNHVIGNVVSLFWGYIQETGKIVKVKKNRWMFFFPVNFTVLLEKYTWFPPACLSQQPFWGSAPSVPPLLVRHGRQSNGKKNPLVPTPPVKKAINLPPANERLAPHRGANKKTLQLWDPGQSIAAF